MFREQFQVNIHTYFAIILRILLFTVPSENKRDLRTIEQVMADNRAKRLKTVHNPEPDSSTELHDSSQTSLSEET